MNYLNEAKYESRGFILYTNSISFELKNRNNIMQHFSFPLKCLGTNNTLGINDYQLNKTSDTRNIQMYVSAVGCVGFISIY